MTVFSEQLRGRKKTEKQEGGDTPKGQWAPSGQGGRGAHPPESPSSVQAAPSPRNSSSFSHDSILLTNLNPSASYFYHFNTHSSTSFFFTAI